MKCAHRGDKSNPIALLTGGAHPNASFIHRSDDLHFRLIVWGDWNFLAAELQIQSAQQLGYPCCKNLEFLLASSLL
jgi:hypothetical protein